jgi:phage tail-like protein
VSDENTVIAVDSLIANEFQVLINDEVMQGVFRVSGLTTFQLDPQGGEATMERQYPPFKLIKMVQRDGNNPFNKWLRETRVTDDRTRPRRTLTIVAIDDGVETRRWTVKGAWIREVTYSDFDTGSSEMIEEIVTVHYDDIDETWSATPNPE